MKTLLKAILTTTMLTGLTACVVAPPYPGYVEPGVSVVVPPPYYGPVYPYYGPANFGFGFEYRSRHHGGRRH